MTPSSSPRSRTTRRTCCKVGAAEQALESRTVGSESLTISLVMKMPRLPYSALAS